MPSTFIDVRKVCAAFVVFVGFLNQTHAAAPATCGLAQPAFCDTFDAPAGNGNRSGDLDGTVWGVSRALGGVNFGQGQYSSTSPTMMDRCGQQVLVQPPNDVAICNGRLVEAQDDQHGVTSLAMYPKQPFDFAGRTGRITFDVSDDTHGTHRAWPEFWLTDKPVPAPFTHFSSLQEVPFNGFGIRFASYCPPAGPGLPGDPGCGVRFVCHNEPLDVPVVTVDSAVVVANYQSNDSFTDVNVGTIAVTPVDCVKASSGPGDMNHFEMRVSQTGIDVYGTDAGTTSPLKLIATIGNVTLPLTRGLIWIEDVHYNGDKDGMDQGTHTFTWDNVGFDGPILPRDLAFDVPDRLAPMSGIYAGLLNLGWGVFSNDAQPLSLTAQGVYNVDKATAALLTFNYYSENPPTLSYRLNGAGWHDLQWPFGACYTQNNFVSCGSKTVAAPVPLAEVHTGDNIIEFKTSDASEISNVDLILVGAGGIHAPDAIFIDSFDRAN
jgi:hypothetical protein